MVSFVDFFFVCAGHSAHPDFDSWFGGFLKIPNLSALDRSVLEYTVSCSESGGTYPAWDYYSQYYVAPARRLNRGELAVGYTAILEGYGRLQLSGDVTEAIGTTQSKGELLARLRGIVSEADASSVGDAVEYTPWSYKRDLDRPITEGIMLGIPEIDTVTNGFQQGQIASICGFTGSGKTQLCLSTLYRAAASGKKCLYISLELDPKTVQLMLQTRWMYSEKGHQLNSQDLMFHKLSGERKQQAIDLSDEFENTFSRNVMVVDSTWFPKDVMMDTEAIKRVYAKCERHMGGLDLIILDHVNRLQLLYTDKGRGLGNEIIVKLCDAGLTFKTLEGKLPTTIFAVQTNRAGWTQASKNGGRYSLTAISDLNEVERSSAYCVFIFTDMMSGESQEAKICMPKHRFGSVVPEPVTTTFMPQVVVVGDVVSDISYEDAFSSLGSDFGGGFGGGSSLESDLKASLELD